MGRADIEFSPPPRTATGRQLLQANAEPAAAASLFGINPSTYDLWSGRSFDVHAPDELLRWREWRRLPRPRTPGSIYRQRCEVEVLQDQLHAAELWPWPRALGRVRANTWLMDLFESMPVGRPYAQPVIFSHQDLALGPDQGFTYASGRRAGKSEAMRVVAVDHGRRELTFTADAVYERRVEKSRVPAGLQKQRLDGRRSR